MLRYLFISLLAISALASCGEKTKKSVAPVYDDALLHHVRLAAAVIPGALPTSIHYVKYASTARKWKDLVEDGSDDAATMARTVFQIAYADGYVMVDAGMDRTVHHFFEKESPQPFDDTLANKIATALQTARLILITHEHGDHVAGVVRNANDLIPPKTILTKEQVASLVNNPQMPEIKLDQARSRNYIIADFETVLPVAPGIVLIKAPGHTAGEIMIYTKLQNGKEYLFAGDVSWTFKGIQENKPKPKSERKRVGEEAGLVEQQLQWLNKRLVTDKMVVIASHDDVILPQYAAQGLLFNGLVQ